MPRPTLPGYRDLAWMMFMQPVALERHLKACGIGRPNDPAWKLLRERGPDAALHREYVGRMWMLRVAIAFVTGLFCASVAYSLKCPFGLWGCCVLAGAVVAPALGAALGGERNRRTVGGNVFLGMMVGLALATVITLLSVGTDVDPWRIPAAAVFGLFAGFCGRVALTAAELAAFGVTSLVPQRFFGSMVELALLVARRLVVVLAIGGAVAWIVHGQRTLSFVPALPVVSVILVIALPRACIYPLEAAHAGILYLLETRGTPTLDRSLVLAHELSYLPYPCLAKHLLYVADRDPVIVRHVLDACNTTQGQRRIGREVLAQLQARELETHARRHDFAAIMNLASPHWLPGRVEGIDPLLARVADLGRALAQAEGSAPHARLLHLEQADRMLRALEQGLLSDESPLGQALRITIPTLRGVIMARLPAARREAESTLPNPFSERALDPSPARGEVFRGRDALIRQIRTLLVDDRQGSTLVVLGPRRCGKTSLLKMLPSFLPDAICVFFDPQNNDVASPAKLFVSLSRRAHEAAEGHLDVPILAGGASFDEGCAWFQALEAALGDRRMLLCLDEIERLEELYRERPREIDRMLGLFRATMQHGKSVRLLISAKAPFEEHPGLWNDHFISAQEIWLDHLDERDAVSLLTRPTRDFPPDVVPPEVARALFARTGGQPFLLQMYGKHLISRLNEQKRWRAAIDDVAVVEEEVLVARRAYFANIRDEAPPEAQRALDDLAEGHAPALGAKVRAWLSYRRLLTQEGKLRIPVLGRWIREYG